MPFSFSHAGAAGNLDAATQGVSNGRRLYKEDAVEPSFSCRDYLSVHHVRRNY